MTEEKDTKIVPCKWYSEVESQGNCLGVKRRLKTYPKEILHMQYFSSYN